MLVLEADEELDQELDQARVLCLECERPTWLRKPYCTAHVLLMPYVVELLERTVERVRQEGQPSLESPVALEILEILHLDVGSVSAASLARRLWMSEDAARAWMAVLVDGGLAERRSGGRIAALPAADPS